MAVAVNFSTTPPTYDTTQSTQIIRGNLTLSGVYGGVSSNGDTLNFTTHPVGVSNPLRNNRTPLRVLIYESPASGTAPTGYTFQYGNGTNAANGVLIVTQATGGVLSGLTATSLINAPSGSVTNALGVAASALTSTSGATSVTGVTTTITGSGSAAGGPNTQITANSAYPSALVTAATAGYLKFEAVFPLGI